jgi:nucleotide-binding universal stress UspA family protein
MKTITFKKILWPTDFSEPSYEAFKTAKELASHFSSELYLVHVIRPLPPLVEIPRDRPIFNVSLYRKELQSSAEKSLQEVINKKIGKRLKVHAVVANGDAAVEINRIAKRENVELIVIATQGTTGRRSFFLGSVAEKLVRITTTPVLTIRAPHKEY